MNSETTEKTTGEDVLIIEFRLDQQVFGVPVTQVLEVKKIQKPTSVYRTPDFVVGVMNLRGNVVALLDLGRLLNLNGIDKPEDRKAILLEHEGKRAGVVAEEIIGTRRINRAELETVPESVDCVSDRWLQGVQHYEGRTTVILDAEAIFTSEEVREL